MANYEGVNNYQHTNVHVFHMQKQILYNCLYTFHRHLSLLHIEVLVISLFRSHLRLSLSLSLPFSSFIILCPIVQKSYVVYACVFRLFCVYIEVPSNCFPPSRLMTTPCCLCTCMCIPFHIVINGSVNTFSRQRIPVVFYASLNATQESMRFS